MCKKCEKLLNVPVDKKATVVLFDETKETYDAAREKFKANQFGKPKKGVSFILKERAICGYCGGKIRGGAGKTEKNKIRRYYSCSNRMQSKSCQKKHMKKELIEQLILDTTFKIFENLLFFYLETHGFFDTI